MTFLDEKEKLLLARARQEFMPEKRQAHRVHAAVVNSIALGGAALTQGLASGSEGAISAGAGAAGGAGAATGGKLAALSQAVGALSAKAWLTALAVTTGVSAGASLWVLDAPEPTTSAVAPKARPAVPTPAPSVSPAPAPPGPSDTDLSHASTAAPSTNAAPPELAPAGGAPPGAEPSVPQQELPRTPAKASSPRRRLLDLGAELSSVRDADSALNAGDPMRALAILDELERSRGGALRQERAALRVLAHCQLETPSSTDRARRFLRAYPTSVYAPRVQAACER